MRTAPSRQFIYHFPKAACGELASADVDAALVADTRYLHIMGCSITGSPSMGEAIIQAARLGHGHGVKISFDPNIRPELMHGTASMYYQEILRECDVLLTGKSELKLLLSDAPEPVDALLRQKDRLVVVKDGARKRGGCESRGKARPHGGQYHRGRASGIHGRLWRNCPLAHRKPLPGLRGHARKHRPNHFVFTISRQLFLTVFGL